MKSRLGHCTGKKRAVENALHRLGMQAKPEEVIAALARQGIEVSLELVRLVRFDLLRAAARMRAQAVPPYQHSTRPQARHRTTSSPRTRR